MISRAATAGIARWRLWIPILACVSMAGPGLAFGELGGNVATVDADQKQMKGTRSVTSTAAYSVHEIQGELGIKVREFVSPAGTVFGVAWEGPWKPDLKQLLGPHFDRYVQGVQSKQARRGAASVREPDLVVESHGHMRSFSGRAFLPQMIPTNVDPSIVK